MWGPEGLDEADAHLLGDLASCAGAGVLEVGAGAAQCARWLLGEGAEPVALDISGGQLRLARRDRAPAPARVPLVQADAAALPSRTRRFDLACSAYGAVPFVADRAR